LVKRTGSLGSGWNPKRRLAAKAFATTYCPIITYVDQPALQNFDDKKYTKVAGPHAAKNGAICGDPKGRGPFAY